MAISVHAMSELDLSLLDEIDPRAMAQFEQERESTIAGVQRAWTFWEDGKLLLMPAEWRETVCSFPQLLLFRGKAFQARHIRPVMKITNQLMAPYPLVRCCIDTQWPEALKFARMFGFTDMQPRGDYWILTRRN